ncbi:MAG: peptidoglycan DD-metalloendopeptidase family protein [Actinomycetota bacterium]|nr:peptidoglycan DD-metalloendopeptidase family protein [Actinomycetota bacterium]
MLATLVALVATAPGRAAATGPPSVTYRPPVDAPVVDAFRPPPENWNAGNRGLEYATVPGTPVVAAAAGEVVFAGPVAGGLHVVVLHDDGLRTSYSFLHSLAVRRGDKVAQGQALGTAEDRFHFGARAGDAYLDPAKLFGGGPPEVHLVPDDVRRPQTEAQERAGLARLVQALGGRTRAAGGAALDWAKETIGEEIASRVDEARGALHYAEALRPSAHVERFADAAYDWVTSRATCTPEAVPTPKLQARHILVRVAGLGSSSEEAAVDDVDAAALGYAAGDVYRYSYRGGTTAENAYAAADTTNDIRESARRLGELLIRLEAAHPGVPIDIVAHSLGGLVARQALTDEADPGDRRLPKVSSLVTLGTPHRGAPAATGLTMVGHTTAGEVLLTGAHAALPNQIDPSGTSVAQMAEHSEFIRRLNGKPLPAGLRSTSIGAREDLAVPAGQTKVAGAHSAIVSAPGHFNDHGRLPGSPEAQREIALGLAGMTPTCESFGDAMADAAVSDVVYTTETAVGAAAWAGARYVDAGAADTLPRPTVPRRYDHVPSR